MNDEGGFRYTERLRLFCQDARKLDQFRIDWFGASDDVCKWRSRDLVFSVADQYAGLTIAQRPDGIDAQPGGQQAIKGTRRIAAYDVSKRSGPQLKTGFLLIG